MSSASRPSSWSFRRSKSVPSRMRSTGSPTCRQMAWVTFSLSPVRIFTGTPYACNAWIAALVVALGGSSSARKPRSTMPCSSATENCPTGEGFVFCATAITRMPWLFSWLAFASTRRRTSSSRGSTLPPHSAQAQHCSISSTAPLVTSWVLPSWSWTTTLIRRRWKSKGISSTLVYFSTKAWAPSSSCFWMTARSMRFFSPVWK